MPADPAQAGDADAGVRRELTGWAALAVGALAIAGAFAFLLAISRVPGVEWIGWPIGFFHKGLVIHVVFSFVVWFLAVFGAHALLAQVAAGGTRRLDGLGLAAVAAGVLSMPLLFIPALLDRGLPTLNNYVPVIIDPLYYAGLALLALAIGIAAVRLLISVRAERLLRDPVAATVAAAAVAYLSAFLCFALALRLLDGTAPSHEFNERLTWGGGHVLQFVNTLLLLVAWQTLAAPFTGGRRPTVVVAVASAWLLLGALAAPALYLVYPPFSPAQTAAFTWLQYLLGPPAALVAIALLAGVRRPWPWREPGFLALVLSILLFGVGGGLGLFVDGADTRTPAHYHGVIAGVTLAFFGVFFTRLLPLLGRTAGTPRRQRIILHVFAWGQLTACIGLFVAGGHGAPRKVAGEAQGLTDMAAMIGMGLNGLGGLVAVIGGIMFVWTVGMVLLCNRRGYESTIAGRSGI